MRKYCAEFIGTLVLVFGGCGSAMFLGTATPGGHLAVAFAFGLSIVAMAYVIGNISGCHINPAVSFAMLLQKKLTMTEFVGYIVAQILGGIAGAAILKLFVSVFQISDLTGGLGANGVANAGGVLGAFIIEIILTFIFVFAILGVTSDDKKASVAGIVIGLTLTFVHIIGIPLTGTSVNPARSLGPALFVGGEALKNVWIFILAPLVGAALASIVFSLFKKNNSSSITD